MRKIFFFDVETTGLNPLKNGIISLSYIIDIDGVRSHKRTIFSNPGDVEIDPEALRINGISREALEGFDSAERMHEILLCDLSNNCNKFDSKDKMFMSAYRGEFDKGFLEEHFRRMNDQYFGSWFNGQMLDPLPIIRSLDAYYQIFGTENHKLATIAKHLNIDLDAHKSDSDVEALRDIWYMVMEAVGGQGLSILRRDPFGERIVLCDTIYEQIQYDPIRNESFFFRKEYPPMSHVNSQYSLTLTHSREGKYDYKKGR